MTSCTCAVEITMESSQKASSAQMARTHARGSSVRELDPLERPDHDTLSHSQVTCHRATTPQPKEVRNKALFASGMHTQPTPNEIEARQHSMPLGEMASRALPSVKYPRMNKWRVLCASLIYFGNGMSDSSAGALIPYIEEFYHIGYAIVSMIWIANAAGFIVSAFFTDWLLTRCGRARTLMIAEGLMIGAYITIACSPPFPAVIVAYFFMASSVHLMACYKANITWQGLGNATNLALNNVFCANLADSTVVLGLAHGSYGVGGIVAPIAATAMVSARIFWARFYLIMIATRTLCFVFAAWSFWNYEAEPTSKIALDLHHIAEHRKVVENGKASKSKLLRAALKNRTTLVGALFIFAYQGAEVAESGWFISYLINYRHGDPTKVGYVTSGFWAGITIGRFTLTHFASRVGEKRFVFVMGLGVIVFQLLSWLIPHVIGNAVSVAILGLLLGPVYPGAATVFTRLLPRRLQTIAIGFISSAGSSGGAVVPFITGIAAQSKGTWVLHPICIGSFVMMLICWILLPQVTKPTSSTWALGPKVGIAGRG